MVNKITFLQSEQLPIEFNEEVKQIVFIFNKVKSLK